MSVQCPQLNHILKSEECLENLAGLGATVYVGVKGDLESPMTATDDTYSTPQFASGKGLYKIEGKTEAQKYAFSSLGRRKGYELTGTVVIEALNHAMSKCGRALNNLDIFLIFKDGENSLIMYDPDRTVQADSDRQATCEFKLKPVKYPLLYVTEPATGGWDSLLASE